MSPGRRFLAVVITGLVAAVVAAAPSGAAGAPSPLTDPAEIQDLAADAYIWGVAPEFVDRFEKYDNLVTAKRNTLGGGHTAAAWNNNATNAPTPGSDTQASILPPPNGSMGATYVLPAMTRIG